MASIELVIKISEDSYKATCNESMSPPDVENVVNAIKDGTPLPKGHGRLIDESKIKNCGWNFVNHHAKTDAPTIIDADRKEQD